LDERAIDREVRIIKGAGGKSGGRVPKAAELIAGDLLHVSDSRLRMKRFILTLQQKNVELMGATAPAIAFATNTPAADYYSRLLFGPSISFG
jgi:hypothetical protein